MLNQIENRQFSPVVDVGPDGDYVIEATPCEAHCEWFGCQEKDWYMKVWREAALSKKGLANTPHFENVFLCERHYAEGEK